MRKFILGCLGTAAVAFTLHTAPANVNAGIFTSDCTPCGEAAECDPCEKVSDPCEPVCSKKSGWFVNGSVEAGFWANSHGVKNTYDGTRGRRSIAAYGNGGGLLNVANTGGQLNQLYISAGKSVDGKHGLDIGGTVDFVFGTDARFVQTKYIEIGGSDQAGWGTGDYYSAFAQAYFEAEYKKWNFKAGKFYTPFGSQGFRGSDNFFYSFAPDYGIVPATATGGYATYSVNKNLAVYGGWVQPDIGGGVDSDNNALLVGAIAQLTKKLNVHYAFGVGENSEYKNTDLGFAGTRLGYFVNSLVAKYQVSKKLSYTFDWSYLTLDTGDVAGNLHTTGFNNEFIYQYNKKWGFGLRFGYVNGFGADNQFTGFNPYLPPSEPSTTNSELYSISLGANYTPTKWLVIKPELRYDELKGGDNPAQFAGKQDETHRTQFSGGVSTVVKF